MKRGIQATVLIYQLTSRVQSLIQQSHLESHEGWSSSTSFGMELSDVRSMVGVLVTGVSGINDAMHQPLPRNPISGASLLAAIAVITSTKLQRS